MRTCAYNSQNILNVWLDKICIVLLIGLAYWRHRRCHHHHHTNHFVATYQIRTAQICYKKDFNLQWSWRVKFIGNRFIEHTPIKFICICISLIDELTYWIKQKRKRKQEEKTASKKRVPNLSNCFAYANGRESNQPNSSFARHAFDYGHTKLSHNPIQPTNLINMLPIHCVYVCF